MSALDGSYVDGPDGTRVWQPAAKPARPKRVRRRADGSLVKPRPALTDAERAERFAFQRERLDIRRREIEALEALAGPRLHVDGESPVEAERVVTLDARTAAGRELVRVERPNGSTLRANCRTYDGAMGGRPKVYALLAVWFRKPNGTPYRSKGVAVEGPELRVIGKALLALADEYEAACELGVDPWAQPGSSWVATAPAPELPATDDCLECGGAPGAHLAGCRLDEPEPEAVAALALPAPTASGPVFWIDFPSSMLAKQWADVLRSDGFDADAIEEKARIVCANEAQATDLSAHRIARIFAPHRA